MIDEDAGNFTVVVDGEDGERDAFHIFVPIVADRGILGRDDRVSVRLRPSRLSALRRRCVKITDSSTTMMGRR